ncbi:MAG: hypothetical protein ACXAEU_08655 [Candidatus Hodarchaeales archaeon]|jgi:sRNA-binding regulator protein Hfq
MEMKEKDTFKDMLVSAKKQDKPVDVHLKSGKSFNGNIITVGVHCLALKLRGNKSFFDAIIRIEDIAAIEVQVRTS